MIALALDGLAHSTNPARSNQDGRPMKLETACSRLPLGRVGYASTIRPPPART
jgi:hypothetical protein